MTPIILTVTLLVAGCQRPENARPTPMEALDNTLKALTSSARQGGNAIDSAFFGLDNDLPFGANLLVRGAYGQDGMPVNFNDEIDAASLDAEDFLVIDSMGAEHIPKGATLRPANEDGENRTVLLIGEFGDGGTNPPVEVRIVGDLLTKPKLPGASAPSEARNLIGASTKNVIPLSEGPKMFFAQILKGEIAESTADGVQIVQVAWQGGITPVNEDIDDRELYHYYSIYVDDDGDLMQVTPSSIADINDNDNYHQLLVETALPIVKVSMPAGVVKDPNGDPNPATEIQVGHVVRKNVDIN